MRIEDRRVNEKIYNDAGVPNEERNLQTGVIPVLNVNPREVSYIVKYGTGNTTANVAVYSIGSEDFYLTSINVWFDNSSTCDCSVIRVSVLDENGNEEQLVYWPISPISSVGDHRSLWCGWSLPFPLKLRANSTVTLIGTFTAGALTKACSITGFTLKDG